MRATLCDLLQSICLPELNLIRPSLLTGAFVRESAMRACSWVAARPRHLTAAAV
jgi:hypothetical protein